VRIATLSWLLAAAACLSIGAAAAQEVRQEAEPAVTSAAGMAVLEHAPRLSAPADTAQELKRILAQDEFQESAEPAPRKSWIGRMWDQFQLALDSMGSGLTGTWGAVLAVVLLIALAFLVVRLLWGWSVRGRDGAPDAGGSQARRQTAEQLREAADLAAGQGDFRAAIRFRYLALLRALNLATTALMTNSQIKRSVSRRHPALAGSLGQLVTAYEDTWYGGLASRREDYELASDLARGIEEVFAAGSEDERASE
jgi:hypothetical protein